MIIWQGYGMLVVVVTAVIVIVNELFWKWLPINLPPIYTGAFGLFLAGAANFIMGKKLHASDRKILMDKETGQDVVIEKKHTIFFIKIEYWGLLLMIFGVAVTILALFGINI